MKNEDVAYNWRDGFKGKGSHMFTDGKVIYSYGTHFPIAIDLGSSILFNKTKYSRSTTRHQNLVKGVINKPIEYCDINKIKQFM